MLLPNDNPNQLIISDFELASPEADAPSEAELFGMLCDRISWLIEHNMGYLLSLLYRNDVLEWKINEALAPDNPDPANIALAKLVMERQHQRLATKKQYGKQSSDGVDEDLRW
ncbi:MAG: hypothetical protein MUC59_08035 [Saprospiraceae bacterium]|jgi:hypothetical protein|nr:hypothetical protein [Saprospiraceae bacterium]